MLELDLSLSLPPILALLDDHFLLRQVTFAGIFVILALGLNLINGFGGMLLLGHHGFWAVGALVGAGTVMVLYPTDPETGAYLALADVGMHVRIAIMATCVGVATLAAMISGLMIGIPCLRLRGDYLAIATLSFGEIVLAVGLFVVQTKMLLPALRMPSQLPILDQGDARITFAWIFVAIVWTCVVATAALIYFLIKSTHGRAILALREDEVPAELSGVNVAGYKLLLLVVGAGTAGLAGALYTMSAGIVAPNQFEFVFGVIILMMVLLGGQGSITGAVLGAVILYSLREMLLQDNPLTIAGDLLGMVGYTLLFLSAMVASQSLAPRMRQAALEQQQPANQAAAGDEQWTTLRWALLVYAIMLGLPLIGALFGAGYLSVVSQVGMAGAAVALLWLPRTAGLRTLAAGTAALHTVGAGAAIVAAAGGAPGVLVYATPVGAAALLLFLLAVGLRFDRPSVHRLAGTSLLIFAIFGVVTVLNQFATLDLSGLKDWWQVIFAVLLVVLMLNAPRGMMGRKELNQTTWWNVLLGRVEPAVAAAPAGGAPSGAEASPRRMPSAAVSSRPEGAASAIEADVPPSTAGSTSEAQDSVVPPTEADSAERPSSASPPLPNGKAHARLVGARWLFAAIGLIYCGAAVAWTGEIGWTVATVAHLVGAFAMLHLLVPALAFPFVSYVCATVLLVAANIIGWMEHGLALRVGLFVGLLACALATVSTVRRGAVRRRLARQILASGAQTVATWRATQAEKGTPASRPADGAASGSAADLPILDIVGMSKSFGGLKAVSNFDIQLKRGELVGLIGPNGAGKTTVFNLLTGVYTPSTGRIELNGTPIQGRKPYEIVLRGVARTFQNIRLFKELTVLQNVRIAFNPLNVPRYWHDVGLSLRAPARWFTAPMSREREFEADTLELDVRFEQIAQARGLRDVSYGLPQALFRTRRFVDAERQIEKASRELLSIFQLEHRADELAGGLPYGEQRRLEIARALATQPRLLILDEPAAGMNPQETEDLMHLIRWIRESFDLTILLIEHDMSLVMNICERLVVIDHGEIIARGLPAEIQRNPDVIKAYLGEEAAEHLTRQHGS